MPMADNFRSMVWVDANGNTRQTLLRGNASLGSVSVALLAHSYADWLLCFEGPTVQNMSPAPTTGAYQNVGDYAVLVYTDGSGNNVYVTLPAPQSSIFLADQFTVDDTQIATIDAAVIGTVLSGAGSPVTAFVAGFRRAKLREYQ